MTPHFSVITVSYNSEKTIEQTILSVLNQTYSDYEYLIVDGGSTDATLEIIKCYEGKFNGRLRWVSEADSGIYFAMNKGIDLAKGKYIGLLNSDDWYEYNALEVVAGFTSNNTDIIYGMLNVYDDDDKLLYVYANYVDKLPQESLAHPSTFVSQKCYKNLGAYTTEYLSSSDYEFFLRAFNEGVNFKFVESILANFRCGGMSSESLAYFETLKIRKKYGYISNKVYLNAMITLKTKTLIKKIKSIFS
jgi:glycosyltransferase involved in cell wall biosynthesis